MRILLLFIVTIYYSFGANLYYLTQEEKQFLQNTQTIKMCNNPNWEPIEFVKDGVPSGIAIDVIKNITKKLKLKVVYVPTKTWVESQQYLKEKKCDFVPAATVTKKRLEYAIFTKPYLNYKLAIITQSNKPLVTGLNDILDKTISRKKGSGLIAKLKAIYPKIKIVETSGYEESLKMVSSGEVYCTIATLPVASHYISKFGLYNLHIAGYLDKEFHLSISVRDDMPILRDIFDKVLEHTSKNKIAQIETKWASVKINEQNSIDYKLIINIVVVILFIIIGLLFRHYQLKKSSKQLQDINKKIEKILALTMEGIILIKNNKIIDINNSALLLFDQKEKQALLNKDIKELLDENSHDILESFPTEDSHEVYLIKNDDSKIPVLLRGTIFDKKENIILITILDLTEIKRKDEILAHNTKMAQMGEMIENIAHQWRQPLSVITTAATGLQIKHDFGTLKENEINDFITSIVKNANYLSSTIDTFRNFIKEKAELRDVVIQERIDKALEIVKTRIDNKHIKLINNIDYENKLTVKLIVGELSQVLINIINNAIDALIENNIEDKKITIDLLKNTKYAIITIEDNAGGIPKDILPKIFEPYFTTKHQSIGTGIGLYMSYDIIVNHMKGKLYAKNTKTGAKFYIYIPLSK